MEFAASFTTCVALIIRNSTAQASANKTGSFPLVYAHGSSIAIDPNDEGEEIDPPPTKNRNEELEVDDIPKSHKQLGHSSHFHYPICCANKDARSLISPFWDAFGKCNCHRIDSKSRSSFGNRHLRGAVGEVVFADIPHVGKSRQFPADVFADAITRYIDGDILEEVARPSPAACYCEDAGGMTWRAE